VKAFLAACVGMILLAAIGVIVLNRVQEPVDRAFATPPCTRVGAHGPALPAAVGRRELEFGRNVTVGWHVAVDFEADADFN
jgi:hypothetical protein